MSIILTALWPLFMLIVAGYGMRRMHFPGEGFWPGAERFNYFVLFPALLFSNLATAPLHDPALPRMLLAVFATQASCALALLLLRRLRQWPGARFGVLLQGVLRFNTYLGLATVGSLFGKPGLLLAAVILAVYVPTANVLSILGFTDRIHWRSILIPVFRNPLILACIVGVLFNLAGGELKWGTERLLGLLANTSLPLGLLCVGAALKPSELHGEVPALLTNSLSRLFLVPSVALACAGLLQLPPTASTILVLFFALPTAPTAYVLTRQFQGDSHLMAGIITVQTALSAVSLLVVLSVVGSVVSGWGTP